MLLLLLLLLRYVWRKTLALFDRTASSFSALYYNSAEQC